MLQSDRLKQFMVTIGIYQLLSNCTMYENICPGKTKKLYTYSGKYNDQLQFRSFIESPMVSTPEIYTDNILMLPGTPMIVKSVVQENIFVNLLMFLMSKIKLLSAR